jgi:hypothetical protein
MNWKSEGVYLDFLGLVNALLIIADVKVVLHVEELVDVILLTCHLGQVAVTVSVRALGLRAPHLYYL